MSTAAVTMMDGPLVEPHPGGLTRAGAARLETIDILRGLVIAIMVVDHVRDFFHWQVNLFDPTDPVRSNLALYLTRWMTHLCAPTFVFLSGVSIYLQRANGKTGADLSRFLVSRGLWLIVLECTLVMMAWNFGQPYWLLQVIWAIGWAMIGMALLAHLPPRIVLGVGILIVGLSPFAMPTSTTAVGAAEILRHALFGAAPVAGAPVFIAYAIIPWLGVMAIGFGLGPVFAMDQRERRRILLSVALASLAAFVLMRTLNGYGNPEAWRPLGDPLRTAMFYFNVWKYPPSPDFVTVTLGLSLLLFLALEHLRGPVARVLGDFGRTPLFTYVLHLYIAHALMLAAAIAVGRPEAALNLFAQVFAGNAPQDWGWGLGVVYLVSAIVIALLIHASRWMADVKRRRRDWWLGYV